MQLAKKRERLAVYDVVRIVQSKNIQTRLERMALAAKWEEHGKTDLAEFVSNGGTRVVNDAIETAKELNEAQERLKRANKSRVQLLEENAACPCIEGCDGEWISAANEILASNFITAESFASAIYAALKHGRGRYRNVYISMVLQIVGKHFFWPH